MGRAAPPALLWLLPLLACAGEPPALRVDLAVSPTPPIVGPARMLVTVSDAADVPVMDAIVTVVARLGNATQGPAEAVPAEGGTYVADPFPFPSAGEWTVRARVVRGGDTVEVERSWTVSGR